MLSNCRGLDLTDEKGFLCGKILADLGADIIKVEPPGGDPSRRTSPFLHNVAAPDHSLYWAAYNSNKRGITLDIRTADGQRLFRELVKTCDFVMESSPPGFLDGLGLGYADLAALRPELVMTSITPFGQEGPYRDYVATDLVVMGMAGMLHLTGDADRAPVNFGLPQSHVLAGADGAVGTLVAYHRRLATGKGQHVDVSMQQSVAWFLGAAIPYWELNKTLLGRVGNFRSGISREIVQRQVWPCKDGYLFFHLVGGITGAKTARQLVKWMDEEGKGSDYLRGFEWEEFDMGTATQEVVDSISKPLQEFFLTHTKKELLEGSVKRNISICPLSGMGDLLCDANLEARGFWSKVEQPEMGTTLVHPRHFVTSCREAPTGPVRAPGVGEHNRAIYGELGLSSHDLVVLKEAKIV